MADSKFKTSADGALSDIIREYTIGEFRGDFPNVPTADGVDLEALSELDPEPLFVTLPVVPKVGSVSTNGLLYDDRLLGDIEEQINPKRPGANFGHLTDAERDTAFPKPDALWVGALRVGETLWGKAYVRPGAARDYIKTLRAVNGSISTSIFGRGKYEKVAKGVRRLTRFDLETLDFAPPSRAALGGGVTPSLTAEMSGESAEKEDNDMDREQIISELTVADVPDALRTAIVEEANAGAVAEERVTELTQGITDRDAQITELTSVVSEFKVREFESALDGRISELLDWSVEGEEAKSKFDAFVRTLRSRVVSELNGKTETEAINEALTAVWEDLKPLAETVRDALSGPSAIVGGKKNAKQKLDTSPAAVAAARAKFNF